VTAPKSGDSLPNRCAHCGRGATFRWQGTVGWFVNYERVCKSCGLVCCENCKPIRQTYCTECKEKFGEHTRSITEILAERLRING
jgi:hypothetical protein